MLPKSIQRLILNTRISSFLRPIKSIQNNYNVTCQVLFKNKRVRFKQILSTYEEEKEKRKLSIVHILPFCVLEFAFVAKLAIVSLNLVANLGRCEGLVVPACLAIGKHDHAWIVTLDTSLSSLM